MTNKINSPVVSSANSNLFSGGCYTAGTLGFVPQLLSIGLDEENDVTGQLTALLADMVNESAKLIKEGIAPSVLNAKSKIQVLRAWAKDNAQWQAAADEAEARLPR